MDKYQYHSLHELSTAALEVIPTLSSAAGIILTLMAVIFSFNGFLSLKASRDSGYVGDAGSVDPHFKRFLNSMILSALMFACGSLVSGLGDDEPSDSEGFQFTVSASNDIISAPNDIQPKENMKELELVSTKAPETERPMSNQVDDSCFTEGTVVMDGNRSVEILLHQGDDWYRVQNQYGETYSKRKSELACS